MDLCCFVLLCFVYHNNLDRHAGANSIEQDQTASKHQGLHYLPFTLHVLDTSPGIQKDIFPNLAVKVLITSAADNIFIYLFIYFRF